MKNNNVEELKEYYEKKLSEVKAELLLLKKEKIENLIKQIRSSLSENIKINYNDDLSQLFIYIKHYDLSLDELIKLNNNIPNVKCKICPCYLGNSDIGILVQFNLK